MHTRLLQKNRKRIGLWTTTYKHSLDTVVGIAALEVYIRIARKYILCSQELRFAVDQSINRITPTNYSGC